MWIVKNPVENCSSKNVSSSYGENLWINVENSRAILHREKRGFSAV
jgi:hypothetical protein